MKRVCVVTDSNSSFIDAHIFHLNAKVIYTSQLPVLMDNQTEKTISKDFFRKIKTTLKNILIRTENKRKEGLVSKFLRKEKIDIVLAEYGITGVSILDICKKNNIPLVVHFHGYDAYQKDVLLKYKAAYNEMFRYAKAIIAVSRDMEKQLLSIGADSSKLHYNVYGVDVEKFTSCDVLNSPKQLLAAGRFVEKKAPYLTIIAFKKVVDVIPSAKLLFVGGGSLLNTCKQIVISLKLSENVIFYGEIPHAQINDLMQVSRAFIQHSIVPPSGDSEGTPVAILEAQTCGLPVISTKHAGIPDVVLHGQTGYLVNEGDVDSMAEYIIKVLQDPLHASDLGKMARENALKNFTIKKSISHLQTILNA